MGYWTCKFIILLAFYYASLAIEGNTYHCVDKFWRGQLLCNIRAVYTRENKPWLTLAAAYIRRKRNHLYEYGELALG